MSAGAEPGWRRRCGSGLVWAGFAAAVVLATKPVWSRLLFGFEPGWEDVVALSGRCLGGF